MKKIIFVILALFSFCFSSLVWQVPLDSEVTSKVVLHGNNVLVVTDAGNTYLLNPTDGSVVTKTMVGLHMLKPVVSGNNAYLASSSGKLARMDSQGTLVWSLDLTSNDHNVSYVYGFDVYGSWIYLTTKEGVYRVGIDGKSPGLFYNVSIGTLTPPTAGSNYIVFGDDDKLKRLNLDGSVRWQTTITGKFWTSAPVVSGSNIVIGALDKKLHYVDLAGGYLSYTVETENWIMSTPVVSESFIYFGSNDGKVYAVDELSGKVKWTANVGRAVQTQPELGYLGGKRVVFVGSNDNNIYAIETLDGKIVWKGSTAGWVESPLYHGGKVIFGSRDNRVYAYSTERACSIISPKDGDTVGIKEVVVQGSAVSESGNMNVHVKINKGTWNKAIVNQGKWTYYVDPSKELNNGLNVISCKVSDAAGEESGVFTSVTINKEMRSKSSFIISLSSDPGKPKVEKPFVIYVNDGDDSSSVERFSIDINGYKTTASNNLTLIINDSGELTFKVSKIGFNDATKKAYVESDEIPIYYYIIGVVVLVGIIFFVYNRFIKK